MKQQSENLQYTWPLFAYKSNKKVKKLWEKTKKTITTNEFRIEGDLMRLGKKNMKPKIYHFKLDFENILYYFKKATDKIPKGSMQLNENI